MTVRNQGSLDPQALTPLLEARLRAAGVPGAAVALLVDGQPAFAAGIGDRDPDGATPLDADAQCYVYSVTKTLLAVATLQLAERGEIALDAPIQTRLPELPIETPVTVRQLLSHTSGLPDYGGLPAYFDALRADPTRPWSPDEFLERTLAHGLLFEPGQGWAYSNIGYLIVKLLLERVIGGSLRDALAGALFAPLGLRRTFVAESLADAGTLTPGYSAFFSAGAALENIAPRYHPGWVSHGVVISTAPELARVMDALFAGELLRPESLAAMLEPTLVPVQHPHFARPAYGLGLMLDAAASPGAVAGHGGGGPGYSIGAVQLRAADGRRVVSVALANSDQGDVGLPLAFALAPMEG